MKSDRPFAETLQALLEERDWSERELSRQLRAEFGRDGTSNASIAEWRLGTLNPTRPAMERVAAVMRIDPDTFAEHRLEVVRDSLNWRRIGTRRALRNLERLAGQ